MFHIIDKAGRYHGSCETRAEAQKQILEKKYNDVSKTAIIEDVDWEKVKNAPNRQAVCSNLVG